MIILGKRRGLYEIWTYSFFHPPHFLMGLMKLDLEALNTVCGLSSASPLNPLHTLALQAGLDGHSHRLPCSLASGWVWSVQSLTRKLERGGTEVRICSSGFLPPSLPPSSLWAGCVLQLKVTSQGTFTHFSPDFQ